MMIPVNTPLFNGNEKLYLNECIDSGWVSAAGGFVKKFEAQFASYLQVNHATTASSGTAALEMALYGLDLKAGDEVILPSFTMISCLNTILRRGLTPRFCDVDVHSWNIDHESLVKQINKKTKAILVVHTYGRSVDFDPILKIAKDNGLKIIEDCAEALGAEYKGKKVGQIGDVSCFSFFANKVITTGEGGMVASNDQLIIEKVKRYKDLFFGQSEDRFYHEELGYNFRMSNIQAALGLAQLEQIESLLDKKIKLGEYYNRELSNISVINTPVSHADYKHIYWMFGIVLKAESKLNAKWAIDHLKQKGIETRPFFNGLHRQPFLKNYEHFQFQDFPITDFLSRNGFYIPSGAGLSMEQQKFVVTNIKEMLRDRG